MQGMDPFAIPVGLQNSFYPLAGYDNSRDIDRDISMMKEMYPLLVRQILLEIEHECDKLEYAGSFMFDEIPDKTLLMMMTDKIYRKTAPAFMDGAPSDAYDNPPPCSGFHGKFPPNGCSGNNHDSYPDGSPNWLSGLINVLLCSEMCERRRRYRRRKNMFLV